MVVDVPDMGRRLPENRLDGALQPVQHRFGAPIPGEVRQPLADHAGKPGGIAASRSELLVRQARGPIDHPGETTMQADPVLVETGAWQGHPVQGPEKRKGTSRVHGLTGLILVASCLYWS